MKVAYALQRYGAEVLGGAELGARMLAERVQQVPGWDVEVFTTCALDTETWADSYDPGTHDVNGVPVHRFRVASGRDPGFGRFSDHVLEAPKKATREEQERWVHLQGPVAPDLLDAVAASDADVVVYYPYLFWPTVAGITTVDRPSVLHPAAHDEAPIRLPIYEQVFAAADGLVFQAPEERRLVTGLHPVSRHAAHLLLGLGVEERAGDVDGFRARSGIGDAPYVLCLGRVDDGKGTGILSRFFAAYKDRNPGPLKLALVGPIVHDPHRHPDIVVTGPVDEVDKWGALRGATALVNPSPHEAFSIVVMEGWTVGLPVVVNGRCEVTAGHARASGGGLAFDSYAAFEAVLDRLVGDAALRASLGAAGRRYVDANYTWPVIIDRYTRFLARVAAASPRRRPTPA